MTAPRPAEAALGPSGAPDWPPTTGPGPLPGPALVPVAVPSGVAASTRWGWRCAIAAAALGMGLTLLATLLVGSFIARPGGSRIAFEDYDASTQAELAGLLCLGLALPGLLTVVAAWLAAHAMHRGGRARTNAWAMAVAAGWPVLAVALAYGALVPVWLVGA